MHRSFHVCRALMIGCAATVWSVPASAHAQCTSSFQLFAAPAPRNLNFAFYEPATGRTIATETPFVSATVSDTWSWDGAAWHRVAAGDGPVNVIASMVARDTARNRVVAVGQSGETWEWDGTAWSHPANCPSNRCNGAAITYDAVRGVTLLVTGGTGTAAVPLAETWEWNGAVWTQRTATGPSNRHLHTLTYDPVRNVSVLIGGQIESSNFLPPTWLGDLWEFNGSVWTQRTFTGGPGTTSEQGAVYHAALGGVVVYGGRNLALKTQMLVWNGTTWTTVPATTPGAQQDTSLMSDPVGGRLLMLGRIITTADGSGQHRWQLFGKPDAGDWSTQCRADDFTPSTGYDSAACFDSGRGVMVVFGGVLQTGDGGRDGTTWEYDGAAWHKSGAVGPGPRNQAAMAYDPVRHRVVMVGGYDGTSVLSDTWEYDGAAWTLASTDPIAARNGHALAYDAARGRIVLHGGHTQAGAFPTDTLEWDGTAWTQRATNAPHYHATMAFDEGANALLGVFNSGGTRRLDDPGVWNAVSVASFSDGIITWDSGYGRLVGSSANSVRSWNGSAWQAETVTNVPPFRTNFSVVYDSRRDHLMVYGGWRIGYYTNEMWEWTRPTADLGRAGGLPGPDGVLNNNDFIVFITHFFNASPLADVGRQGGVSGADGHLDNNDFIAFIDLFFNGCGV